LHVTFLFFLTEGCLVAVSLDLLDDVPAGFHLVAEEAFLLFEELKGFDEFVFVVYVVDFELHFLSSEGSGSFLFVFFALIFELFVKKFQFGFFVLNVGFDLVEQEEL
jgi:hypothetical protein